MEQGDMDDLILTTRPELYAHYMEMATEQEERVWGPSKIYNLVGVLWWLERAMQMAPDGEAWTAAWSLYVHWQQVKEA